MEISGDSRVIGTSYRTALEYAALINGTFGHGFELDDYCTPCGAHVGIHRQKLICFCHCWR